MNLKNEIDKSYKDMTPEERALYKEKRKKKNLMIAYFRRGVALIIVLAVVIIIIAIVKLHSSKSVDSSNNDEVAIEEDSSDYISSTDSNGLKISDKKDEVSGEDNNSDNSAEDADDTSSSNSLYYANETSSTESITSDNCISQYAIVINNDSKEVIATKSAYEKMIPASMTKVMTVYSAVKRIDESQLDEIVTMSNEAISYSYAHGCSTSGFVEGEEVTVRDLLYGTILPSGGDAACQLAMYVAGDVDSFMELVNDDLEELGISDTTHFTNPIGYYDEEHYSTCYDIAIIMMAAMDNEILSEVLSTHVYQSSASNVNAEGITLSNWFLRRIEDKEFGGTIYCAKTGFVNQSGNCAVSSEISDSGTTYICVTGNATSSWRAIYDHVELYTLYGN